MDCTVTEQVHDVLTVSPDVHLQHTATESSGRQWQLRQTGTLRATATTACYCLCRGAACHHVPQVQSTHLGCTTAGGFASLGMRGWTCVFAAGRGNTKWHRHCDQIHSLHIDYTCNQQLLPSPSPAPCVGPCHVARIHRCVSVIVVVVAACNEHAE